MKHTAGDWLRDGRTVYALQESDAMDHGVENRFTAGFYAGNCCSEEEAVANAQLAMAAPDLLYALETAEFVIKCLAGPSNAKDKALYLSRKAISKALGK
ncbi:hypothetical protein [Ewingella americana]|uniref:hypothetical protein n=1 Tax=Ewingella americana TaxID=41202 RepID=UPI0012AE1BC0|nr:hypothetical protein [Ewingella americana]MRT01916.1 hypothetical protein [Ewingella americana]